jgi:glucose/mannose-6-phosphate isomerase
MRMDEMIRSFPHQINDQWEALKSLDLDLDRFSGIENIVIAGMGGSAISGDIAKMLSKNELSVPITVVRDYSIPRWTDDRTLFILSSYSGNTEETISCFKAAILKSKKIISISTGGEIESLSRDNDVQIVGLPSNYQPRAALGFSLITLLTVLSKINLISSGFLNSVVTASNTLDDFYDKYCADGLLAESIAKQIKDGVIAIYGVESSTDSIASRFRAQIAENSKMLSTFNVIPEMNHNEIEAWNEFQFLDMKKIAIWIHDEDDHPRILDRIKITSKLLEKIDIKNIFIKCSGGNYQERCLKLLFLNDWISYYLAKANNIDPIPVNRIMNLKSQLS